MFTTRQICDLCELPWGTVIGWVQKRVIKPAVKGGVGRGNTHRFNDRQATGLAVAAALHQSERRASASYVGKVVETFEAMNDGDFERWIGLRHDQWATEECAGWEQKRLDWLGPNRPSLPGGDVITAEVLRRLRRVGSEIGRQLQAHERAGGACQRARANESSIMEGGNE